MLRVTLDTNCIIDIEESRPPAKTLKEILSYSDKFKIALCIPSIQASERSKDGVIAQTFDEFKLKLARLGMAGTELILPLAYWGIAFWDNCLGVDADSTNLEPRLHDILFPEIPFHWEEFKIKNGLPPGAGTAGTKWLNAKCDVLALWSHIHFKGDVFVTSDGNFLKQTKKPTLLSLGAGQIFTPDQALEHITNSVRAA